MSYESPHYATTSRLELPGHRSDVRCLALSPDDSALLTGSSDALKLWNPRTGACLATMDSGYALSVLFVPGNKFAVLGTKVGLGVGVVVVGRLGRVERWKGGRVWAVVDDIAGDGSDVVWTALNTWW